MIPLQRTAIESTDMTYFDTHAHYYDERFDAEAEGGADALIRACLGKTVSYIINVGTEPSTSRKAIEQAKKYPRMFTAVGIHPSDARLIDDLEEALRETEALILDKENKCVAIGEIGLDYHYPETDKEMQKCVFRAQMEMAKRLSLPVVIHDRDSHEDVMNIIREYPGVTGVLHSFSGSAEMAKELVSLGYMISFSGTVSFKNARKPKEACAAVPLDRLLIETDCPYLTPHPHRGKMNHSGYLRYTAKAIAEVKGTDVYSLIRSSADAAKTLFDII